MRLCLGIFYVIFNAWLCWCMCLSKGMPHNFHSRWWAFVTYTRTDKY